MISSEPIFFYTSLVYKHIWIGLSTKELLNDEHKGNSERTRLKVKRKHEEIDKLN